MSSRDNHWAIRSSRRVYACSIYQVFGLPFRGCEQFVPRYAAEGKGGAFDNEGIAHYLERHYFELMELFFHIS
ncbi:hypothetical protein Xazr_18270 [Xanthomonas campestris pv. azadirachtae]|nr:hypothetical protein Xazr_18270 [Xanthomonas campestris pv. azadirachtae]